LLVTSLFCALALNIALIHSALAQTTITVDTAADVVANDGQCSLREAITAANTNSTSGAAAGECPAGSGADTIAFTIGATGPQTITLSSALPNISEAVTIDGSTQPGFAGVPLITLDGNAAGSTPVQLSASNSTLKDFAIVGDNMIALLLSSVSTVTLDNLDLSRAVECD